MLKEIWDRRDTRIEAICVGVLFLLIVVLWLGGRHPRSPAGPVDAPSSPFSTSRVGSWTVSLMRVEVCPERKLMVAVVEVACTERTQTRSPVFQADVAGFSPDGGVWAGPTTSGGNLRYAGAGGQVHALHLKPGSGAAVLRFRGVTRTGQVILCVTLPAGTVCLPPADATIVSPQLRGPLGIIFGQ